MKTFWKVKVEKLGKIDTADINITPLTMFVGDNNSGKSYLMTLIYTLLNIRWYSEGFDLCKESNEYALCEKWIEQGFAKDDNSETEIELTKEIQLQFQNLLNLIISRNLSKISQRGFNADVKIGKVTIEFTNIGSRRFVRFGKEHSEDQQKERYSFRFLDDKRGRESTSIAYIFAPRSDLAISLILENLLKGSTQRRLLNDACYLPASRTGFLLNYRAIVNASLSDAYDQEQIKMEGLTRPCSDFLKNLARLSPNKESNRNEEIVRFIEQELLHGNVRALSDTPQSSFIYHSNETGDNYPMYLSSGVITELAPLMLLLKYWEFETMFIEEPEISLHPKLQQMMARVMIRLSNKECLLFVTTHSDTILQHINNMIKLNKLEPDKREQLMKSFGYNEQDLLSYDKVSMYQFDVSDQGRTTITQLSCGPYGFEVPSFNSALQRLLDETYRFEGDAE